MPRCGLGNKMLVWAKALLFARKFDLPFYTFGWEQLNVGPLLRGEKSNRYYGGYFKKNGNLFERIKIKRNYRNVEDGVKLIEPDLAELSNLEIGKYQFVVFNEVPPWNNYFGDIHDDRETVRQEFMQILRPSILRKLNKQDAPSIGMHIRLGDFRAPREGESFKEIGGIRTPMEYFIEVLEKVRETVGSDIPATLFTNGKESELSDILNFPNVSVSRPNSDIVDLLLLGRSDVIVTSARSTFGYWSGFFSEVPIIMHPDHIFGSIRSATDGQKYFEGSITEPIPPLLEEQLLSINNIYAPSTINPH